MEQFSLNVYPLINKSNNVVCVYDQHNNLWTYISNGFYKSTHIDIILTCSMCLSYTVIRIEVFEYKCMHVVFEYKCMHL